LLGFRLARHNVRTCPREALVRKIIIGRGALAAFALLAAFGVAACSPNSAPSSAGSGNGSSTTPAATTSTSPKANAAPSATSRTSFVPMQSGQGGEFLSPSGNISCEIDYNPNGNQTAYCETGTPAQSVTMSATGSYITCAGEQCLGNAGIGTPTLAYGTETGVGPFVCESATTGITCTANGRGFRISRSGITPV
jgi:hypothetical protein